MTFKGLTQQQGFSLLLETTSARQLLAQGCQTLLSAQAVDAKLDAVLTCWSIGAEKISKVLIGVHDLDQGKPWPNLKKYGHDLEALDTALQDSIKSWLDKGQRSQYLNSIYETLDQDPLWPALRTLLSRYGSFARFYHLDSLSDRPQDGDSPVGQWNDLECLAIETDPSLRASDLAIMSNEAFANYQRAIHQAIVDSLVRWWFTITRLGRHGALGEDAIRICADIEPQNALPRIDFKP